MTMLAYRGGPVVIGSTTLHQLESLTINPGIEQFVSGGGGVHALLVGTLGQKPAVSGVTPALEDLLGEVPYDSALVTTCEQYMLKQANGGQLASGSVHTKFTLKNAHAILRSISASQGETAKAAFDLIATYDGTNAPIAVAHNLSAPAAPSNVELFTLGPLYLDTTLVEVQSIDFDTGIKDEQKSHSGGQFTEISCVVGMEPSISFETLNAGVAAAANLAGDEKTVTFFLRKLQANSGAYSDASEEHIKVEMLLSSVTIEDGDSGDGTASLKLKAQGVKDGANAIVSIATDQAIVAPS